MLQPVTESTTQKYTCDYFTTIRPNVYEQKLTIQKNAIVAYRHELIQTDKVLELGDRVWIKNVLIIRGRRVNEDDRKC